MEQVTDSRWELRANREHSQRELRVNSNSLNQSRLQYLTEMGEVTTSQSSSPQGTQQNVVPFTEKKMSMPTFCSYFEGHLPQPFQVEEASNRTQEKLREGESALCYHQRELYIDLIPAKHVHTLYGADQILTYIICR